MSILNVIERMTIYGGKETDLFNSYKKGHKMIVILTYGKICLKEYKH